MMTPLEVGQFLLKVLTDHKNLEYLWIARLFNHCQIHWSLFSSYFASVVSYDVMTRNGKIDALSHKDKYLKAGDEFSATVLKMSSFVNKLTDNSLMFSNDMFTIQIQQSLNAVGTQPDSEF